MRPPGIGRILLGYFFRGLLLLVPVTVIGWAGWQALSFLDGIIEVDIPGLGLLTLLAIITVAGWLASSYLFQPFLEIGDELLQKVPFLKTLYGAVKDLMEAMVGKKRRFDRPVLVKLDRNADAEKVGFITEDDLTHIGIRGGKVGVYLPHAFNWSGNLVIVPVENVTPLNANSADVMKFVVSGGVSKVADEP
ncbi:MAG: DUF502 domain-containing protein [Flavobacteriales bacterium]|jgi:uncharacterized membrane protein|nr:DUF502 domain-containing protein [Flavobacteriales bacterium]